MNTVDIEPEKKEIMRAMEELETAENRKDIEGILDLIAEDIVFVNRDSMIEGKQETEEMLRKAAENYISSKHIPLRIEVSSSGDMAWLLGYELNKREGSEGIVETKQSYILTFRKVEGKWKQGAVCIA
jgi:ketosteroid isomerase-like protein